MISLKNSPQESLTIPKWIYYRLLRLAKLHPEEEVCGLLAGLDGRINRYFPIENIHHSPSRYLMNPKQQLKAFLWMESHQMDLIAIYHSHPSGPNHLSVTDMKEITFPDSIYLIIHPEGDRWKMRAFRIDSKSSLEIPIHKI